MYRIKTAEIAVGLFIILGLVAFFILALKVSGLHRLSEHPGFTVHAEFDNIGDLKVRAPVTIAGVRIGKVANITLDKKNLKAVVDLKIDSEQSNIPDNVNARVLTQGLLGSNYIELSQGYDDGEKLQFLKEGSQIAETQPALILENIIGQLVFNANKKDNSGEKK